VQNVVNWAWNRNVVADIDFHQTKSIVPLEVGDVVCVAGHEVVEAHHVDALSEQAFREMRPYEPRATGQYRTFSHVSPDAPRFEFR
jgi:hypothetical protein